MSTLSSPPLIPPQPSQASYGVDALELFKTYSRDSFQAAFGVQAPAWNAAYPPKAWFDSSVDPTQAGATVTYQVIGQDPTGQWVMQNLEMSAAEAAAINLQGSITYPPYAPAASATTRDGYVVNRIYLTMQADAQALMTTLGGTNLTDDGASKTDPAIYPPDEQRRIWQFTIGTAVYNAGLLLASEYAQGVGWPGHWDQSRGYPVWVADPPVPTGVNDPRPQVGIPVRALLPNEQLGTLMGIGPVVIRTDLTPSNTSAGFTEEDRGTLQQILQMVGILATRP